MRKSRISGAERRSCRPDLTEREAVAEEAGRSPPTGGAYLIRRPGLEVVEQPRFWLSYPASCNLRTFELHTINLGLKR